MNKLVAYLDDVKKEMKKVNWPSQQQLIDNTVVTLVGTVVVSLIIYGADQLISLILEFIYV